MSRLRATVAKLACAFLAGAVLGNAPAASQTGSATDVKVGARSGQALLRALVAQRKGENVLVSPFSLDTALTLAALGANGSTLNAFKDVLGVGPTGPKAYADAVRVLAEDLAQGKNSADFTMANAAWIGKDIVLEDSYVNAVESALKATTQNVDFSSPDAAAAINAWVAKETGGAIDSLVSDTSAATRLMLTNAISFKGKWQQPFDVKDTRNWPFRNADGSTSITQMMFRYGDEIPYAATGEFEIVRLPYAGGQTSLQVMVPRRGIDLRTWLGKAKPRQLRRLLDISGLKARKGYLGMPKLHLNFEGNLVQPLRSMGLGPALSSSANFSGMAKEKLFIGQVVHKVMMKIDEEGTEAAAATGIGMSRTAIEEQPPAFSLIVDRPFLLVVRHEQTGAHLFLGYVAQPN